MGAHVRFAKAVPVLAVLVQSERLGAAANVTDRRTNRPGALFAETARMIDGPARNLPNVPSVPKAPNAPEGKRGPEGRVTRLRDENRVQRRRVAFAPD